ncbi:MAG: DUF1294 domain-containing protein [Chloroflexi bacterium]|nr:DUF1294 domain-containing protein [Chloroflexota bacterium]
MGEHFTCVDCGRGFTVSYEKQRWFREKGWAIPKRCDDCLARRKRERGSGRQHVSASPKRPPVQPRRQPTRRARQSSAQPSQQLKQDVRAWWYNPAARFGLLSLVFVLLAGLVAGLVALIAGWPWWVVVLIALLAINVITLVMYRYDKAVAGTKMARVPEAILWLLALCGGSPAALVAMYGFEKRHKTSKLSFLLVFWLILAVQIGLCLLAFWLTKDIAGPSLFGPQ